MISLKDSIEIRTTPKRVFDWLGQLPQVYKAWHPDHVNCEILRGEFPRVGSVVKSEEYLHGKLHSMQFQMTKVVPDRRVEFNIQGLGRGAFEAQPHGDAITFIAELDIGSEAPLIGHLIDFIFTQFFTQRIEAMKKHMVDEGQNLKAILEADDQGQIDIVY